MSESPVETIERLQNELKFKTENYDLLDKQLDNELALSKMLTADNRLMRQAGMALAEAALRVCREYDGTHRLLLAIADWSTAVAGEGGRAGRHSRPQPAEAPPSGRQERDPWPEPDPKAPMQVSPVVGPNDGALPPELGDSSDVVGPDLLGKPEPHSVSDPRPTETLVPAIEPTVAARVLSHLVDEEMESAYKKGYGIDYANLDDKDLAKTLMDDNPDIYYHTLSEVVREIQRWRNEKEEKDKARFLKD